MTAWRKLWILVIVRRHHHAQVSAFIMPTSYLQEHSLVMFLEMKADGEALYRAHPVLRRLAACDLQNPWEQALKWVWSLLTVIDASRELWMQTTLLVLITDTSGCKTRCQLFVEGGKKKTWSDCEREVGVTREHTRRSCVDGLFHKTLPSSVEEPLLSKSECLCWKQTSLWCLRKGLQAWD